MATDQEKILEKYKQSVSDFNLTVPEKDVFVLILGLLIEIQLDIVGLKEHLGLN